MLFAVLLAGMATLLQACKDVKITDSEWCADIGTGGAACFTTLSQQERTIAKPQWDHDRFGQICTNASTFADWKKVIEQLCTSSGECSYEMRDALGKFFQEAAKVAKFTPQLSSDH